MIIWWPGPVGGGGGGGSSVDPGVQNVRRATGYEINGVNLVGQMPDGSEWFLQGWKSDSLIIEGYFDDDPQVDDNPPIVNKVNDETLTGYKGNIPL